MFRISISTRDDGPQWLLLEVVEATKQTIWQAKSRCSSSSCSNSTECQAELRSGIANALLSAAISLFWGVEHHVFHTKVMWFQESYCMESCSMIHVTLCWVDIVAVLMLVGSAAQLLRPAGSVRFISCCLKLNWSLQLLLDRVRILYYCMKQENESRNGKSN